MPAPETPRLEAARIVAAWLAEGRRPDRMIAELPVQRAIVTELVMGVVRRLRTLQFWRQRLATRPPAAPVEAVVLVALYELFYLDDTADYAAVNEAVESAGILASRNAGGFVNAVLRRAIRERAALRATLDSATPGVRFSEPDALIQRWQRRWGPDKTLALCEWNNRRPVTTLRAMTHRISAADLAKRAAAERIELLPHPARPEDCLIAPRGTAVDRIPGYAEGLFVVQDPSTLGAVGLVAARAGETIVDACAAPGGKTAALADAMGDKGLIIAGDPQESRLERLNENMRRLKLTSVKVEKVDAADLVSLRNAMQRNGADRADAVLLDVPCSNTGVLQRRADARWRFDEVNLRELCVLQARLLDTAALCVRPGGRLVYSTCSLEAEENEQQVQAFLRRQTEFTLDAEVRSFPPDSGTDGAYAARVVRSRS